MHNSPPHKLALTLLPPLVQTLQTVLSVPGVPRLAVGLSNLPSGSEPCVFPAYLAFIVSAGALAVCVALWEVLHESKNAGIRSVFLVSVPLTVCIGLILSSTPGTTTNEGMATSAVFVVWWVVTIVGFVSAVYHERIIRDADVDNWVRFCC